MIAVVTRPFDRFFNEGEDCADPIDLSSTRIMEELDGSLIIAYSYNNTWQIATSSLPDATGSVQSENVNNSWEIQPDVRSLFPTCFADYFKQVARLTSDIFDQPVDNHEWTYLFELMGPLNRVVVDYPYPKIVLLGARHSSGIELTAEQAQRQLGQPFQIVQTFSITNVKDLLASFSNMHPFEQEGYVGCDAQFNRRKFKNPKYVAWHHVRGSLTTRAFVDVVRSSESDEFCASFKSFGDIVRQIKDIQHRYLSLISSTDQTFKMYTHLSSRKDFAMQVKHLSNSGALFYLWQNKTSSEGFYRNQSIDPLMIQLGLKSTK